MARPAKHIFVCTHERPPEDEKGSCAARAGNALRDAFASEFEARGLWGRMKLSTTSCLGVCEIGPAVLVYPEGVMYGKVMPADIPAIIDEHLLGEQPIERLLAPAEMW